MRKAMTFLCGHTRMTRSEASASPLAPVRDGLCPECWESRARASFQERMDAHGPQLWIDRRPYGGVELMIFGGYHIRDMLRDMGWALSKRAPSGDGVEMEPHTPGVQPPRVTFGKAWWRIFRSTEKEELLATLHKLRGCGVRTTMEPEEIVKRAMISA